MANRYWVGGTNTWNATVGTKWSATSGGTGGASVPTSADAVFFDQAGPYTVTITSSACASMTVSAGSVTFDGSGPLTTNGNITLNATTTWNATSSLTFNGTGTITSNGVTINSPLTFSGTELRLGSTLTLVGTTTFSSGALILDGFDLTTGNFNSDNSSTRSIAFGSNFIITTNGLSMATMTNFTWTGTGGFKANMNTSQSYSLGNSGGASASNAVNVYVYTGSQTLSISTLSWFNILDCTGSTGVVGTTSASARSYNINTLVLDSGAAVGAYTSLIANMYGTGVGNTSTINGNGKIINTFTIPSSGTTTLLSALGLSTLYTQVANTTFDLAGFALTSTVGFTFTGGTLTMNGGTISCTTFTFTGPTFTLNSNSTITCSTSFIMNSGSFTLGTLGTLSAIPQFTHEGGTVTFLKSTAFSTTGTYTFNAGTIDVSAGVTLSVGIFSSTNTNARTIAFGTGYINLTHTTPGIIVLSMGTANGFSWTGTTGGFTTTMSNTREFRFGSSAGATVANQPNMYFTGGAQGITLASPINFKLLDFTGCTSTIAVGVSANIQSLTLDPGGTYSNLSVTQNAAGTITGNSVAFSSLTITHTGTTTLGSATTVTGTTVLNGNALGTTLNLNGFDLTTGNFSSDNSLTRSIIFGSNFIVTTGGLSMATMTNFTWTGTGGFKANMNTSQSYSLGNSGGASASNAVNVYVYTGSQTLSISTLSWFNILDCTGSTGVVGTTSASARSYNINTLILSSGAAVGAYTSLIANMYGVTNTINGNGKIINTFTIPSSGTTTLLSALGLSVLYTQVANTTLDLAGFSLTSTASFTFTGGTLTMNGGTISCTTFTFTGPTFTLNSGTINCSTSFIMNSGSFTLGTLGTLGAIPQFTHEGGTVTFLKSTAFSTTGTYTFNAGTIDVSAGVTLSVGIFSSTNTNARTIAFGTGYINLTHTTAGVMVLSMAAADNFNWTGTTGGFTTTMANTKSFRFGYSSGATVANQPNMYFTGGAQAITLESPIYFKLLNFTGCTSTIAVGVTANIQSLTLDPGGTYSNLIVNQNTTGTITGNGVGFSTLTINHTGTCTLGSATTVIGTTTLGSSSGPALNLNGFNLTTGNFSSDNSLTRSIIFGSNFIVTTGGLSMATMTNFTWTGTGGFKANMNTSQTYSLGNSGGASASNAVNVYVYTGAQTLTISTGSWFNILDCTGSTGVVSTTSPTARSYNINKLVLSGSATALAYTSLIANMYGVTNTINGNGASINTFIIPSTGTTTLLSALGLSALYTQVANTTLDLAGFALTSSVGITFTGGTLTMNGGTISCTTFTFTGPTFTLNSNSTINCSTSFIMNSGSFTLGTLGTLGAIPQFTHEGGTVTFLKSTAFSTTGQYSFNASAASTLDVSAGVTLSVGIFSSSNTNARTITFGTGYINLTHTTASTTVVSMGTISSLTVTGTGGFRSAMPVAQNFTVGSTAGTITNAPNLYIDGGSGAPTFVTNSIFKILNFTGSSGTLTSSTGSGTVALTFESLTLSATGTYTNLIATKGASSSTVSGNGKTITTLTLNVDGNTTISTAITVTGTTTFATATAGSLTLNANLTTGTFNSDSSTTRSIAFSSTYITTKTGLSMATTTNFSYTGTGGFKADMTGSQSLTYGNASSSGLLNPIDMYIYVGSATATISSGSYFRTLDCTGSTCTVNSTNVFAKDTTLASGGTYTAFTLGVFAYEFGGTCSINGNGKTIVTFSYLSSLNICNLQSALALSAAFSIDNTNTLNLAGFAFTVASTITCNTSSSIINFGTTSCTTFTITGPNITVNSGSLNCTSFTINSGTYTLGASGAMASVGTFNHTAGNVTFLKSYALTATGTYTFTAGTLTITGFTLSTGTFSSNNTNVRNLVINTGFITLTHTTASTVVLSMADVTNLICTCTTGGFTANSTTVRTFTYGTTGTTPIDNVANLTFTGSSSSTTTLTTGSWFKNLNFGTTLFTIATTTLNLSGFALSASGTYTAMTINLRGSANDTVNSNGRAIGALTINKTGTTTFQSALSCTTLSQTAGDINFATFNLTCSSTVAFTSGTYTNMGVLQCTTFTLNGIFTLSSGTLTPTVSFVLGSGTFVYQTPGTLSAVATFTHTAGSATFSKAYALTATGTYTLTAGDIVLNGADLTTGIFSSSGAGIRSIQFGTNNIILAHTTAAITVINMPDVSNLTVTGTGGFTAAANITRTYTYGSTSGASATNSANLTLTGNGTGIATITTGSWFNKLDFGVTVFAVAVTTVNINAITLSSGGTFTNLTVQMRGTGLITTSGKTIAGFVLNTIGTNTLAGNVTCTSYTQTAGLLDLAGFNIICSGAITTTGGSTVNSGTITCTTFTVNGTFSLDSGTITPSVSFVILSGTFNYNSGGTLSPVPTFTHTDGTVTLGKAYALTATGTYTFTAGTLQLGGFNLTTGIFNSSGTSTRSIQFGTGNIILAHTSAGQTVLGIADSTSFSNTGTGGFTSDMSVTRTFTFGTTGGAFNLAPNLSITGGVSQPTITSNSWFKILNFTGSSTIVANATINVDTLILSTGGTYTGLIPQFTRSQIWTAQFGKELGGIGINALFNTLTLDNTQTYTTTSVCSVVAGTLNLGGADLTIGSFSSSGVLTRSVIFGSNNIILSTPTAGVTVLSVADATNFGCSFVTGGFVASSTITRTFVFGTTGGATLNAPNLTINSGTAIPTITTGSWFTILDFTGSSCTPAVSTVNVSSVILSSGGTFTNLSLTMRSNGSITPSGKTISAFVVNHSDVATTTIVAALNCSTQTYTAGNVDFNNSNVTSSAGATYTSGAFSNINTITCTTFTVTGAFLLTQGTIAPSVSIILTSGSITYNGGTINAVPTFTHTAGTFILGQAYALTATGTYTLTGGSIVLNGYNLSTGIFSSTGIVSRSISFSTGNINLTHSTAAQIVLNMADVTNFTQSATTGGFVSDAVVTRTFTFGTTGGTVTNAPNLAITTGSAVPTITTLSWFNTLNFTGSSSTPPAATLNLSTLTLSVGGTYTGLVPVFFRTQTWTAQFSKQLGGIGFNLVGGTLTLDATQTYTATSQCTLTVGTINLGGADLTIGTFSSNNSNVRSLVLGTNNITLATTTAAATNIDMATATNFTISGTGGFIAAANIARTFSFGSTAGGTATNSPNLTFTSGSSIQTITTASWFNKLDFGTTIYAVPSTTLSLNSLTLSSSGTFSALSVTMVGSGTIISNSNTTLLNLTINGNGITTTLGSALTLTGSSTATGNATLDQGTLDLANFTLTCNRFITVTTSTRAVSFGTGNIVLASTLAGTVVISFSNATNFTWTGTGGFTTIMSVSRQVDFGSTAGGSATNAINLSVTSGASALALTSIGWFNNLNFTGSTCAPAGTINVSTLTLATGGTYTGLLPVFTRTQTWTSQFSKQLNGIGVNGSGVTLTLSAGQTYTATSQCLLTLGTIDLGGANLTIGTFNSNNSNIRSLILGTNNIILSTTTAAATNLDMATATNFTITGTGGFTAAADITRTFTFGTTGGSATNSPNLTINSGTAIPTITTNSWFNILDFTGSSCTPAVTTLNVNSLILSAGGTFTSMQYTMRATGSITSNNKTISTLTINHTGTTTLNGSALSTSTTAGTVLTSGTLNLNNFTLLTATFSSSNTNTRAIAFGTGYIDLAYTLLGSLVLGMADATNFTCTGTGGFLSSMNVTRTFTFGSTAGGSSTNAPNLWIQTGVSVPTITTGSWFNTLNFTGSTCTPAATTVNLNSLILASGGTYTSLNVNMVGTGSITSAGKTIGALNVNNSGTTTLSDAFSTTSTGLVTLTSGTLALAGFTLTTGQFSSNNTNTRSISFGTGNIALAMSSANIVNLDMPTVTNFTWTGTGGFTSAMSVTRTFTFGTTAGGSATTAPNLSLTSGASVPTITSGSWFKNLIFTGTTSTLPSINVYVDTLTLASGGTYSAMVPIFTRTQTWTPQFSKQLGGIGVRISSGTLTLDGTQTYSTTSVCYVIEGTLNLGGANQTFGRVDSDTTLTRSIAFGSNNITLAQSTAGFVVLNVPDATNFTYTGTGGFITAMSVTRSFVFGTTGGSATNAPNLSITSGASVPTFTNGSWFKTLSFTGSTCTPAALVVNVDTLTLATGGTYTGLIPVFTRTQTWTQQFSKQLNGIGVNGAGVTLTLEATQTYTSLSTLIVNAGTLDISTLDLTFYNFSSTGTGSRSITGTGSIIISNNWTVTSGTGFTGSTYSIRMNKATTKTFAGGGGSYGTLYQSNVGTLTVTGSNTFADIIVGATVIAYGQDAYTTPGTFSWVAPVGVTSVCVVCIGGGGGGRWSTNGGGGGAGGGLGWKNDILVTAGLSYTVVVGAGSIASGSTAATGGTSYFINASTTVAGLGGSGGSGTSVVAGGTYVGDGGGNGGNSGGGGTDGSGGGGAGGYTGNGGAGANAPNPSAAPAGSGSGGGAGGGGTSENTGTGPGGGVGILGQGLSGIGAIAGSDTGPGGAGSGGSIGSAVTGVGGLYGGGGSGADFAQTAGYGSGGDGAVRIIWGPGRAYPATNTEDA